MTTTKAPATFQCPDCDHAPYPTAKGLGTHRNKVHGIPGTSKRAIARAVKKGGHQCPECDHAPYPTGKGLATHRRFAHGVEGTSKSSIVAQTKAPRPRPQQLPEPHPRTLPLPAVRLCCSLEGRTKEPHHVEAHTEAQKEPACQSRSSHTRQPEWTPATCPHRRNQPCS